MRSSIAFTLVAVFTLGVACGKVETVREGDADGAVPKPATRDAQASDGSSSQGCRNAGDAAITCAPTKLRAFDDAHDCFDPVERTFDICFECTMEFASAGLSPVCAADTEGRVYVFTTRPDLRLSGSGLRFGHRRDREVYKDLEFDLLLDDEARQCEEAVALTNGGFDVENFVCRSDDARDAG